MADGQIVPVSTVEDGAMQIARSKYSSLYKTLWCLFGAFVDDGVKIVQGGDPMTTKGLSSWMRFRHLALSSDFRKSHLLPFSSASKSNVVPLARPR